MHPMEVFLRAFLIRCWICFSMTGLTSLLVYHFFSKSLSLIVGGVWVERVSRYYYQYVSIVFLFLILIHVNLSQVPGKHVSGKDRVFFVAVSPTIRQARCFLVVQYAKSGHL